MELAFFFGGPGTVEIVVVLLLGVLLFGSKLPELMRNLGSGFTQFKQGLSGITQEIDEVKNEVSKTGQELKESIENEIKS